MSVPQFWFCVCVIGAVACGLTDAPGPSIIFAATATGWYLMILNERRGDQ